MHVHNSLVYLPLFFLADIILASPVADHGLVGRSLSPSECQKITNVVSILKVHEATSFCSSFLGIKTVSSTITKSVPQIPKDEIVADVLTG